MSAAITTDETNAETAREFPRPRLVGTSCSSPSSETIIETSGVRGGTTVRTFDETVERVARSRLSVLITGETGVGKEVLARRIHDCSPRAGKPIITVNCAAFCESLIDSELFGHQKGAFTGAESQKVGLVEAADGGTLFLDEVGELSPGAQAKLLRVLETRMVVRVGSVAPRLIDVRFIAATNREIDTAVASGQFRADLRFRLEGIRLNLAPLRERVAEILPAARRFLEEYAEREKQPRLTLSQEAEDALGRHSWVGNFRELRNVVERAALLCEGGCIQRADLMLGSDGRAITAPVAPSRPAESAMSERDRILAVLKTCAGNQTRAARILGISRRTFVTRLAAHGIPRPQARSLTAVPLAAGSAP